jgi:hypothetical protein
LRIIDCMPPSFFRAHRAAVASCILYAPLALAQPIDRLRETYEFLVSYRVTHGGALYRSTVGSLKNVVLPLSFYDSEQYWGDYVCKLPKVNCAVSDYYDPQDYSIKPAQGPGALLQTERVNVHNGTNIYDAATWQIAVVLGEAVNKFGNSLDSDAYALAANQNTALSQTHVVRNVVLGARALTVGNLYRYNGHTVTDPNAAYSFRMTAETWLADDPLKDTRYASLIRVSELPRNDPAYQPGRVTWSDWKPVTGDNAWAYLVGPLQAAYIHFVVAQGGKYVPFEEQAVKNALGVLPTFAAMQGRLGAVYYAPTGTLQNEMNVPVNPHYVSVENNLSVYAGLKILERTLQAELAGQKTLAGESKEEIARALGCIHTMISGGVLPDNRETRGLLAFFKDFAWHDGAFVQGGFADDPTIPGGWLPVLEPKAVDVNTWGIAALGSAQIEAWHGFGAAFRAWTNLKAWGAYGIGSTLLGVGYSDADDNGQGVDGKFRNGVLSAEWTAGAIVMVRNMLKYYRSVAKESEHAVDAREYERVLQEDERQMLLGVQELRFDRYTAGALDGKPHGYSSLIVEPAEPIRAAPYLYASKRYRIPFGWYANPLPSTSSSAWIVLLADNYDPFGYGGRPN